MKHTLKVLAEFFALFWFVGSVAAAQSAIMPVQPIHPVQIQNFQPAPSQNFNYQPAVEPVKRCVTKWVQTTPGQSELVTSCK